MDKFEIKDGVAITPKICIGSSWKSVLACLQKHKIRIT